MNRMEESLLDNALVNLVNTSYFVCMGRGGGQGWGWGRWVCSNITLLVYIELVIYFRALQLLRG